METQADKSRERETDIRLIAMREQKGKFRVLCTENRCFEINGAKTMQVVSLFTQASTAVRLGFGVYGPKP